jgi:hypothetical protein
MLTTKLREYSEGLRFDDGFCPRDKRNKIMAKSA